MIYLNLWLSAWVYSYKQFMMCEENNSSMIKFTLINSEEYYDINSFTRLWEHWHRGWEKIPNWKLSYTATGVASSRARTPGSSLPSNSSKLAPPPVDMWLMTLATPTFSTAATESPPPIIVVTPFPLRSANFFAIA